MKNIHKTTRLVIFLFCLGNTMIAQNWIRVWEDEFTNGISSDWVFETGNGSSGWGNNELQYYRRENATVVNGNLVITAKKENFGGYNYTSARMKTQGRKNFKYGKIEARIALPTGQGVWPAFWMLGSNINTVGWPACGEIDIVEHVNNDPDIHGTIHWQDNNNTYAYYGGKTAVNVNDYHTYSVEWSATDIRWFVDGVQYHMVSISEGINGTSEFHNDFFLLLNLAIGGNWPGFSIDESRLPAKMYVDYVRVYEKGQGNPTPSTGPVTLYADCPFSGTSVALSEGRYTRAQLEALGMVNDHVSSLKVQSGYQATLYWDDNFSGSSLIKTSDTSCLTNDTNWNDKMTSIVVSKIPTGEASLFIEAENYTNMSGVQKENCSEGGQNVGYIDAADWMVYDAIEFSSSGNYTIEYRVASAVNGGVLSTDVNAGTTVLGEVTIPNTGGWQNWTTVSHTITINAGTYSLGLYAVAGGWNINWIKITKQNANRTSVSTLDAKASDNIETTLVYPNPFKDTIHINFNSKTAKMVVFDPQGCTLLDPEVIESGDSLDTSNWAKGIYIIVLEYDGTKKTRRIIKN
ncbi:carbohydrate-binding protein [Aquimarina sp. 2-A2]|uniref:carbohydrate-binding protein n=1 Tax=Aquimarina sp. 2-A2 TaxID=3382644 RepID=UPI00387F180A